MNILGLALLKLFFFIEAVSCFVLMLVGIGMIEHVNNMVALVGGMMAAVGVIGFVWFGVLFAREEI
tara:strand:- start:244 stop:441 length:198 start_codon:yes stop_codon:yes gene_type:complete